MQLPPRPPPLPGIRNSVGFDWHPDTNKFFFTDNGRDQIGGTDKSITDDSPDCELNYASTKGAVGGRGAGCRSS